MSFTFFVFFFGSYYIYIFFLLKNMDFKLFSSSRLFGWRGERGGVEGTKVKLAKNILILC